MEGLHLRKAFVIIAFIGFYKGILAGGNEIEEEDPCIGKYQGPFLQNKFKMEDRWFTPLSCEFCDKHPDSVNILNNIETIVTEFIYADKEKQPTIMGGPLEGKGEYRFRHMYFNWLSATPEDWAFNNVRFPAELHLVFCNKKHATYEIALEENEGIAILSMGFRVREQPSREFSPDFVSQLKYINMSLANWQVKGKNYTLYNFLPKMLNYYYTYTGAMVSPSSPWGSSCYANVIWIEFEETLKIRPEHVIQFQSLLYDDDESLMSLVTPTLGPKGVIYSSAKSYLDEGENVTLNNGQCSLAKFMAYGLLLSALIIHIFPE